MKKYISIFVFLLICAAIQSHAASPALFQCVGASSSSDPCANRGTAALYYNVDHPSGNTTACISGGTTTVTLTNATASTDQNHTPGGANSVLHEAGAKEYISVAVTGKNYFDSAEGMVKIWFYPSGLTGANYLFRAFVDASNLLITTVNATTGTVSLSHVGQGSNVGKTTTSTVTKDQFNRVDIRWSYTNNQIAIRINGGSWEVDTDGDAVTAFAAEPSVVHIGLALGNVADTYYTDDISLYTTSGIE